MAEQPWSPTNPEWWRVQVEARGDRAWQWLVNEYAALVAVDKAAQRYVEHAGGDGEDADDVCFGNLLVALAKRAED